MVRKRGNSFEVTAAGVIRTYPTRFAPGWLADRLSVTLRKYTVKNYDLGYLVEGELRPQAYRMGALFRASALAAGAAGLALVTGGSGVKVLLFGLVGAALGMFLARSRLAEAVRRRRDSIRAELYTVNQLVAMYTRVGGGALEALRYVAERAHGTAVEEISEVLLLHERGWSLGTEVEIVCRGGGPNSADPRLRRPRLLPC